MEVQSYDGFALDYHHKRKRPWKPIEEFIKEQFRESSELQGLIIDLGCANGRHFSTIKNNRNRIIGIDNSIEFLKIALNNVNPEIMKESALILADIKKLPIRFSSIDNIFSIAVIHHIKKKYARSRAINEISKILKPNGRFILSLWRRWQKKFIFYFLKDWIKRLKKKYKNLQNKRGLEDFGDIIIPWTVSSQNQTYKRFYHLFSKREAKKLLSNFKILALEKKGGPGNRDNFFILCSNQ